MPINIVMPSSIPSHIMSSFIANINAIEENKTIAKPKKNSVFSSCFNKNLPFLSRGTFDL